MSFNIPTYDDLYQFLREHYRHSRFEGRNSQEWGKNYSANIAEHELEQLKKTGQSVISRHDSYNNQLVLFDCRLVDLNADKPPVDYAPAESNLTHILET